MNLQNKAVKSSSSPASCSRLFRWLRLPKFAYVNWHKAAPNASPGCWKQWFSIKRYWGGKLIYVEVRHHSFQFDFRRDWLADFLGENASLSHGDESER
jgi:hypothetical protein